MSLNLKLSVFCRKSISNFFSGSKLYKILRKNFHHEFCTTFGERSARNGYKKLKFFTKYFSTVATPGYLLSAQFFTSKDSVPKTSKLLQAEADLLYQEAKFSELYNVLKQAIDGDNSEYQNAEIYWRLARAAKEMSNLHLSDNEKAKAYTYEAFEYAKIGLQLNSENWACNKWYGILLDLTARYEGTKKRIENSYKVKEYLDKAFHLNPKDATTIHSLGVWCYEFAALPWYQQKIAAAIYATPPQSSFEEALKYFLAAESVDPDFYSYNLLYLGKCYYQLNDQESARLYLQKCIDLPGNSVDDRKNFYARPIGSPRVDVEPDEDGIKKRYQAKEEANGLLKKIG